MKFITEDELRTCYRKEPFTSYQLDDGVKLTPGARQFLQDRGILMFQGSKSSISNKVSSSPEGTTVKESECDILKKKLFIKVKYVELKFLQATGQLLKSDVKAAESLSDLRRKLSEIKEVAVKDDVAFEAKLSTHGSVSGEKSQELDITELHIQLEKGEQILLFSELKLLLEELLISVPCYFGEDAAEQKRCSKVSAVIEQIMNELSGMIFAAYGGNVCQRK